MEHRVEFDFEITFTNGGGIQGQGFRLDIPGDDVTDDWIADALVRDLRLLMVGRRADHEPAGVRGGAQAGRGGGGRVTGRRPAVGWSTSATRSSRA